MIATPSQLVRRKAEPKLPVIEHLVTGDTAAMKNIIVRPVETPAGVAFHVIVMEAGYTMAQTMTGEEIGRYFRGQADAHEHLPRVVEQVRRSRRRAALRGSR